MGVQQNVAPLTISFTNTSVGEGLTYLWNFGDGATSTNANPVHTFVNAGTYSVSLTVTNENGTNTKSETIVVLPPDLNGNGGGPPGGNQGGGPPGGNQGPI